MRVLWYYRMVTIISRSRAILMGPWGPWVVCLWVKGVKCWGTCRLIPLLIWRVHVRSCLVRFWLFGTWLVRKMTCRHRCLFVICRCWCLMLKVVRGRLRRIVLRRRWEWYLVVRRLAMVTCRVYRVSMICVRDVNRGGMLPWMGPILFCLVLVDLRLWELYWVVHGSLMFGWGVRNGIP